MKKKLIDHIRGTEKRKSINAKLPISLYENVLRQMLLDREQGIKVNWSMILRAGLLMYLEERKNPTVRAKVNELKAKKGIPVENP